MMKSEIQEEYFKDYTENPTHKTKKILILISSVALILVLLAGLENNRQQYSGTPQEQIREEWNQLLRSGDPCDSDLYLRTTGNTVYIGKRGVDGEVKIQRGDRNYETMLEYLAHISLSTPERSAIVETSRPFYVDTPCE